MTGGGVKFGPRRVGGRGVKIRVGLTCMSITTPQKRLDSKPGALDHAAMSQTRGFVQ